MSTDLEQLLREGIDRLTAGADVPAGIVGRARRRHRQRRIAIRITAAAGTALVIAVAAIVAVGGAGRAPRSGSGPVQTVADVTSRAQQALAAQAAKGQAIEEERISGHGLTFGFTVLNMALSHEKNPGRQCSRARGAGQRDRTAVDRLDLPRAEPARRDLGHRRARLPQHDPHGHQAVRPAGNRGLRGRLPGQDPVAHHRARPVRPRALRLPDGPGLPVQLELAGGPVQAPVLRPVPPGRAPAGGWRRGHQARVRPPAQPARPGDGLGQRRDLPARAGQRGVACRPTAARA